MQIVFNTLAALVHIQNKFRANRTADSREAFWPLYRIISKPFLQSQNVLTWNYFQSEYYKMCWQILHFNLILFNHKGLSLSLWCDNWKRNQSACIDRFTGLWLRFWSEFDHLRSYTPSSSGYIGIKPDLESFTEWKIRSYCPIHKAIPILYPMHVYFAY